MSDGKSEVPTFWIIAGPNGSGKSTLYGSQRDAIYGNTIISDVRRPFWIINPDLLARRILETAKAEGCDLIVMGSHGRQGVKALILGSVAQKVLTHAHIPVLIVKG